MCQSCCAVRGVLDPFGRGDKTEKKVKGGYVEAESQISPVPSNHRAKPKDRGGNERNISLLEDHEEPGGDARSFC